MVTFLIGIAVQVCIRSLERQNLCINWQKGFSFWETSSPDDYRVIAPEHQWRPGPTCYRYV